MKTKKNIFTNRGGKYPFYKQAFMEKLVGKIVNIFWRYVDNSSCKMEKLAKLYEISIGKEYKKESEIFGISKDNNILHIGCGAYPITAIILEKFNDVKVVAIDKNQKAVKLASRIINEKNLQEKITVKHGNGINYPVEDFDTIIVSSCSMPKVEILEHIFETAKPQSKIIVRELDIAAETITKLISLHHEIVPVKTMRSRSIPFFKTGGWQSFYLVKR